MSDTAAPRTPTSTAVPVDLVAAVVAASETEPRVLVVRRGPRPGLPSGPLETGHRTLDQGLRGWVERQTDQRLGHVEQLYTFGDVGRHEEQSARALSVAYLALAREARPAGEADAAWQDWYHFFPWEDWRDGRPRIAAELEAGLDAWIEGTSSASLRRSRRERRMLVFSGDGAGWIDDRVLERYELLYEAGLVEEGRRGAAASGAAIGDVAAAFTAGTAMAFDHRRILATAIGRLRSKIKYRPVVFELMPESFTLLQLQRTVEALSGVRLHKQNFRRLVESQGLIEETGQTTAETGGRPARLVRFRREVLLERPAPGLRMAGLRPGG
ncbi:NUDIX hydrolase [Methylobrevis pamukkalensis]|uniref:NrtR DNA-binding winged helix domain-containing protein n=1 Tax=Methylobrevis pamukkalensis TaxID=1439726 RepID=A0A1E3H7H4_9HYPH|nr:hypothetical protein [Methylobrevis pamukkalensis]ODN72289.1 hypothetical protein A6302_00354 [Methylobrevis pamukkalensis]